MLKIRVPDQVGRERFAISAVEQSFDLVPLMFGRNAIQSLRMKTLIFILLLAFTIGTSFARPEHIDLRPTKSQVLARKLSANLPEEVELLRWNQTGTLSDEKEVYHLKRRHSRLSIVFFDTFAEPTTDLVSSVRLEMQRDPLIKGGKIERITSGSQPIVGVVPSSHGRLATERLVYVAYVAAPAGGTVRGVQFLVAPADDHTYAWLELARKITGTIEAGSIASYSVARTASSGIRNCPLVVSLKDSQHWLIRGRGEAEYRLLLPRKLGQPTPTCDVLFDRSAIPPTLRNRGTMTAARLWNPGAQWHLVTNKDGKHAFSTVQCGAVEVSIYCHATDDAGLTRLRRIIETIRPDD